MKYPLQFTLDFLCMFQKILKHLCIIKVLKVFEVCIVSMVGIILANFVTFE